MIKNKKKLFGSSGSFRFSKKKSVENNNVTNERSQSDGKIDCGGGLTHASLTKPRSYSPSDYYFHTTAQGGVNAQLTPLSEHYATNESLLSLFSTLYERDQYSTVAYAAGVKFVEVALLQIPKNGYFKSKKYRKQRMKSAADAVMVTKLLGGVVDEMGEDDSGGGGGVEKVERLQTLTTLAQRSFEEAIDDELNDGGAGCVNTLRYQDWNVAQHVSRLWTEYIGVNGGSLDSVMALQDNCCTFFSGGVIEKNAHGEQKDYESDPKSNKSNELESLQERQQSALMMSRRSSLENDLRREELQHQLERGEGQSMGQTKVQHISQEQIGGGNSEANSTGEQVAIVSLEKVPSRSTNIQHVEKSKQGLINLYRDRGAASEIPHKEISNSMSIELSEEDRSELREKLVEESRIDEVDEGLRIALSMSIADSISSTILTGDIYGAKPDHAKMPVAMVAKRYKEKYESLKENGSIHVKFLDTYQGRISGSTNGCTVVAPLMCINYFISEKTDSVDAIWGNGLSDDMINEVIDVHTVSILPEVRRKLGLSPDSFIVPSDVHDYLINVGLLSTSQFVGVCGGSILDDDHIKQFTSTLLLLGDDRDKDRLRGKRLGATFFFAGHVIAFHLINREGCNHVELIDSLPKHEAWSHQSTCSSDALSCEDREPSETSSRYSDHSKTMRERSDDFDYEQNRNAVRVRCMDVTHMDTLIRHYALSKFSDEEKRFCDEQAWQELNSSFDPRVFQAFIWAEA